MKKVLIVLDINGIVCIKHPNKGIRISPYYCIQPIDGYKNFLEILLISYDIAWFSSTTEKNASMILRELDIYDLPSKFKWYYDMTDNLGTVKSLDKVKMKYPGYDKYIIIDDSPEKIECNKNDEKLIFTNYNDMLQSISFLI